ncbi:MAG: HIT domain-containing protein [Patescibacteria group bacterium]
MTPHKDIFCAIAAKEAPAYIVDENSFAVAFLDREPATEGHLLIIPKHHANDIFDISEEELSAVMSLAQQSAVILKKIFGYTSIILHQVNGEDAQDVRHFHLHVYGGPQTTPYFYQQFSTVEDLKTSLENTQKRIVNEFTFLK